MSVRSAVTATPGYRLEVGTDRVLFRTTTYRAEAGSMLHSGIFNRELTSSLAAGAVLVAGVMGLVAAGVELRVVHVLHALALFAVLFVAFRLFVFYERHLELVVDRVRDTVSVRIKALRGRQWSFPLEDVEAVSGGRTIFAPENPDGVRFVGRIASQHGTVIPGFGEVKRFHTVSLEMKDGTTIPLFASPRNAEAEDVLQALREVLGRNHAKED